MAAMKSAAQPWDMVSRPRTALFLQYRQTYQARDARSFASRTRDTDRENLLGGDSTDDIELSSMPHPPSWIEINRQADDIMNDIDTRLRDLKRMMTQAAMPTFDDSLDEEQTVEIHAAAVQKLMAQAQQLIRGLSKPDRGETESDAKARVNVSTALASRLQLQSHALRRLQTDFLKRLQGAQQRSHDLFRDDPTVTREEFDMGFTDEQLRVVANHEALVEERERDINQIAQSIVALAEMFRELQTLVIDQGTVLDRIDYNIELAAQHTSEATEELKQAEKSQKKYRNKLCMLFLIVLAVALVLALAFKPRRSSEPPAAEAPAPTARALFDVAATLVLS